eukprot:15451952-Alexandrium_andersonii.AAC.1
MAYPGLASRAPGPRRSSPCATLGWTMELTLQRGALQLPGMATRPPPPRRWTPASQVAKRPL